MKIPDRLIPGLSLLGMACLLACSDWEGQFSGSSQATASKAQVPAEASEASGNASYAGKCGSCHGADGAGTVWGNALQGCESCKGSFESLETRIHATMPEGEPSGCESNDTDVCARDTAAYILCTFNPDRAEGCKAQVPAEANLTSGFGSYAAKCESCHGADGAGTVSGSTLQACESCNGSFESLEARIHTTMPEGDPSGCESSDTDVCARDTAAYILCWFNHGRTEGCSEASTAAAVVPPGADVDQGMTQYNALCAGCHGSVAFNNLTNCGACRASFDVLRRKIDNTMPRPFSRRMECTDAEGGDQCATNTAAYIFCSFNPGLADGCP